MAASAARRATAGPPPVPGIGPGVPDHVAGVGNDLGCAREDHAGDYSAPISSRVLVEAGFSSFWTEWGDIRPGRRRGRSDCGDRAVDHRGNADLELHLSRLAGDHLARFSRTRKYRATLSYVTGSHTMKFGYQGAYMVAKTPGFIGQQISYRFNNGVPNQLTERLGPTADEQPDGARRPVRRRISGRGPADAAGRPALRARAQLLPRG